MNRLWAVLPVIPIVIAACGDNASGPTHSITKPSPSEHAVIAHFSLSDDSFGSPEDREAFFAPEDALIAAIEDDGVGEYDGNEFGAGEVVVYMYGPDADRLFEVVESHLRQFSLRPAYCVLRYGGVNDPDVRERRIDL